MRRGLKIPAKAALVAFALAGTFIGSATGSAGAVEPEPYFRVSSLAGAFLAARVAETDNDLENAIDFYDRALGFDPRNAALKQNLMVALIANGEFDRSLAYAEDLKAVPDVERFSRVALAVAAIRDKDYGKAEIWLKLSLESDLDRLITGLMTAWAKYGGGDTDGALEQIKDLDGPAWYELFSAYHTALIAESAGDKAAATAAYERIVTNPATVAAAPETFLRAIESYGGFLGRTAGNDKALAMLTKVEDIHLGRLQVDELRKRLQGGGTVEPLVNSVAEGASEVLLDIGSALNRGGGESFVRLYLQLALALNPDSVPALMQLAAVAEQTNQPEVAIGLYEKVPEGSPQKKAAELQRGLNLADLKRYDEATEELEAVLKRAPDDQRAYLALGGVHSVRKDYRAAADLYDRAVEAIGETDRSDWNIFYQRGIAYERLKEWDKAEPNFNKALELYPDQPQVLNYLGYSWVDMDINLEGGLELIRKAVELRPSDGYIVDSLGWAYFRLGRYEEAAKELERAVALMPNDAILNDHLGDAYWRVGRKLEAGFQWAHARDMEPDPDILAEVLKKLDKGLPKITHPAIAEEPSGSDGAMTPDKPRTDAGDGRTDMLGAETQMVSDSSGYVVKAGQSLWSIAAEVLGDGTRYSELLELNPGLRNRPGKIMPGLTLRLPQPAN